MISGAGSENRPFRAGFGYRSLSISGGFSDIVIPEG